MRRCVRGIALGGALGLGCSQPSDGFDDGFGTAGDGATAGETGGGTVGSAGNGDGPADGSGSGAADGNDDGAQFDVAAPANDLGSGCDGDGGGVRFSFSNIWIANGGNGTGESTVSKIDTVTAVEIARYQTGPDSGHFPSRTSVNLYGDVAVGNRGGPNGGGVAKIAARLEDCVDNNANGAIETSSGAGDVLPWGEDECTLWYHPVPGTDYTTGPRPIAWEGGKQAADPCDVDPEPRLWFGWMSGPGGYGPGDGNVRRLDGATGVTLDEVMIPNFSAGTGAAYGLYGGAADADGNFWAIGMWGRLVRIDADDLAVTLWENPGGTPKSNSIEAMGSGWYGIAMDAAGNPWLASSGNSPPGHVWKFDVATETFVKAGAGAGGWLRGIAVDAEERAWTTGTGCKLVEVDVAAGVIVDAEIPLPGCMQPVGVAVDVEGYVWVVDQTANAAFKIDPDTHALIATVGGLASPYTYSDMTGAGLALVVGGPAG
jgi:streptogramin lyase